MFERLDDFSKWWQKYSLIDKSYFPISFSTQTMKHVMIWYLKAEYDISEMHISVLDIYMFFYENGSLIVDPFISIKKK